MSELSERGERLVASSPMAPYILEHFERSGDAWDAEANPDGYIGLCVAENKLVWDLLGPRVTAARAVPRTAFEYDQMVGSELLRSRLADFLGERLLGRAIDPTSVAALGGSGSVLELLFYVIAGPGDGVLVPTPSYTGFWADLETRNELTILPVHTSSADRFTLSIDQLEAAYRGADRPVRALLFTSPSNPLGRVYSAAELEAVVAWCEATGIHLVLDELFALSVFGDVPFTSATTLRPTLGERTHLVWAVSKDLAASGLRCGVLVTENEEIMQAVDALAYWACVSGDTQFLIGELIGDREWVDGFIVENRRRLAAAYRAVTAQLEDSGIPYLPADAGFFFLVDVRRFMGEQSWEAEDEVWRRIVEDGNVNLSPGSAMHVGEPGFLRLVFAGASVEAATEGVRRLARVLVG
jgi:aspartate/methionine/tyrosine aminotransferase